MRAADGAAETLFLREIIKGYRKVTGAPSGACYGDGAARATIAA
jgi:hypothetical protein